MKQRRRETGEVTPRVQTVFRRRALTAAQEHRLGLLLLVQPDATLAELQVALPTTAALSTLWRAIDRLGLTFKIMVYAEEHRRPDVAAARRR